MPDLLTPEERQELVVNFPSYKLSYINTKYKNVHSSSSNTIYTAVPFGKKFVTWFTKTSCSKKQVAIIMDVNKGHERIIERVFSYQNPELENMFFYGAIFSCQGKGEKNVKEKKLSSSSFFSIEDLYIYQGNPVFSQTWEQKYVYLRDLSERLGKEHNNLGAPFFGLPIMATSVERVLKEIQQVPYKVFSIHIRLLSRANYSDSVLIQDAETIFQLGKPILRQQPPKLPPPPPPSHFKVFEVCADIKNDVYHLQDPPLYIGTALVPDYKTSLLLNGLFRKIKENVSLDALEESDEEEEFENEKEDKFVDLDKKINMVCKFNAKFKKWVPNRVV